MQPLNAVDAIAPAWNHTVRLLLAPRNWRLLFKLCVVGFFAQMGGCNASFNSPGKFPHGSSPAFAAGIVAAVFFIGLLALAVGLVLFYVGSRLQFVLFEVVLRRETRIAPIWRHYNRVVWRWIGLKIAFFVLALLCMVPILIPLILHFIHHMPSPDESGPANPLAFLGTILGFIAAIFIVVLLLSIAYILIADFGLPSIALEDVPIAEALRRIGRFIRQEPGQIALYVLMRFVLGIAWALGSYIAILIVTLILLVPLGAVAFALYAALHNAGLGAHAVMIAGWTVLGLLLAAAVVTQFILLFGACFTFLQAYALYFLAGRYPLLGGILDPQPGIPFTPPPVFPSPEENDDNDPGPPMPLDPALA